MIKKNKKNKKRIWKSEKNQKKEKKNPSFHGWYIHSLFFCDTFFLFLRCTCATILYVSLFFFLFLCKTPGNKKRLTWKKDEDGKHIKHAINCFSFLSIKRASISCPSLFFIFTIGQRPPSAASIPETIH